MTPTVIVAGIASGIHGDIRSTMAITNPTKYTISKPMASTYAKVANRSEVHHF